MTGFIIEKSFRKSFATFVVYFVSVIELLGWNYLIYQSTLHLVLVLIEEFYVGFAMSNILDDHKSFKLKWQDRAQYI